jgi:hypothetical protein
VALRPRLSPGVLLSWCEPTVWGGTAAVKQRTMVTGVAGMVKLIATSWIYRSAAAKGSSTRSSLMNTSEGMVLVSQSAAPPHSVRHQQLAMEASGLQARCEKR